MKNYLEKTFNELRTKVVNEYSQRIVESTLKYKQKYGFELNYNDGHEHLTWNCEADAFKHAYGSALMALEKGNLYSSIVGLVHEYEYLKNPKKYKNPREEKNMDTHNNKVGLNIANELVKDYVGRWDNLSQKEKEDIIADRVWKHMRAGDLILDPSGRRTLKNSGKSGVSTGQAVNLSEEERQMLERYAREKSLFAPENRVFYENEMNPAQVPSNSSENNYVQAFVKQYLNNNKKLPTENELKQRVISGELVYVHNYERQDGTKVSGYYRSKPSR